MREIKFRAWTFGYKAEGAANRHRYGEWIIPPQMYYDEKPGDCLMWKSQGQNLEVMQYTGLKDKNGKEIFESDIWIIYGNPIIVKFDEDRSGWFPFASDDGCGCCSDQTYRPEYGEVIGNIHEHPNLLTKEE